MSRPLLPPQAPRNYTAAGLSFFDVLRFASRYWIRQPYKLAGVIGLLMCGAGIETYLPTALSAFLGAIRANADHAAIRFRLGIFLGAYLLQAVIFSSTYILYNVFETHIFKALLDDAFAYVYRLPEHFFANTFTGSIISKINRARQKIENFEDQVILRIFPTIVVLVGSTAFLAVRFPVLALLVTLYLIILMLVSAVLVFKVSGPAQGLYADAQDILGAHLADSISGMATTKAYAQERFEIARFVTMTRLLRLKNVRAYTLSNVAAFVQRLLLAGMLALLLGGGTYYLFRGEATVESMAYLAFAYTIIQSYIRELGENIKNILTSSYDLHAVIRLLSEKQEQQTGQNALPLTVTTGAIEFKDVIFTYPGKSEPIFANLSVTIKAGERVALVGHSGSGKTTFVRLLQCLYDVEGGRISIDGQDIGSGSRLSLRGAIALVPQEPILFHRSLRENIAYGKPDASLAEIEDAARHAHTEDFILKLPHGYETLVGERGIKLSGGERQRVAIARAMLADRPILILDEATSSLDSGSERAIQDGLRALTHGRTSIMIAHRLSTILDADRILVFDKGAIVEEGRHDDLVRREGGIYAGFYAMQSGGFLPED